MCKSVGWMSEEESMSECFEYDSVTIMRRGVWCGERESAGFV